MNRLVRLMVAVALVAGVAKYTMAATSGTATVQVMIVSDSVAISIFSNTCNAGATLVGGTM